MTRDELLALIDQKKAQVEQYKKEADGHNAMQLALKLVLNGSYGAGAAKHYVCFCNAVAASITSHGREATKTMILRNNDYWYTKWHLDKALHLHLGVTNVRPIHPDEVVTSYGDTDSVFVTFEPGMKSCNWTGDPLEFIHKVSKFRIAPFFAKCLDLYAEQFKVKNIQDFEMEQVSKSIVFLAKKMYVKNVVWDDGNYKESNPDYCKTGNYYAPESEIQAKGIDLVRSSTPVFAREKMKYIIKYFFANSEDFANPDKRGLAEAGLNKLIKDIKDEFMIADITDISGSSSCNKYAEKVLDDKETFSVVKGTHYAVKAAVLHNYILNNNPEYRTKYDLIKNGQKIKIYATNNHINANFAFAAGQYPYELATQFAPIDYDAQFPKSILKMVNRFNRVLGMSDITSTLRYSLGLPF